VRWYLRYSLSLRDVEELLAERGLEADHTTIWRWVQRYGPELEQRLRVSSSRPTNPGVSMRHIFESRAGPTPSPELSAASASNLLSRCKRQMDELPHIKGSISSVVILNGLEFNWHGVDEPSGGWISSAVETRTVC
jgi:hypothetical protein